MADLIRNIGLVYYRTSTHQQFKKISPDLQRQECLSLSRKDCRETIDDRDLYCDDESAFIGKGHKRPGFQALTERWKADPRVCAIYIYDLSRLFRDARAYFNYKHELDARGIELVSVLEPLVRETSPSARLPAGILALVNQYNSELYGNKIKDSMRFKAEAGTYPGRAPFGYKNVREEEDGQGKRRAWIEVNDSEAPWVPKAFTRFAEGHHTLRSLAVELAAEGFPTTGGRPLATATLARILKDPIYVGRIEWGDVSHANGKQERLIDQATFDRVQAILAAHNHGGNRTRKHRFLLRGLAKCGECGSRVQASYSRGKMGKYYGFYGCQRLVKVDDAHCDQKFIPLGELESQFGRLFRLCELSPDNLARVDQRIEENLGKRHRAAEATRRTLERSLADLVTAKANAFVKLSMGEVDQAVYDEAKVTLDQREATLREGLTRVEGDLALALRTVKIARDLAANITATYVQAAPAVKVMLASAFFSRLEITDGRISRAELTPPARYVLHQSLDGNPVFQLEPSGGDRRTLLEPWQWFTEPAHARVADLLEKAYQAVHGLSGLKAA